MPLYEYKCEECGVSKDILRPMVEYMEPYFCDCGEQMTRVPEVPSPAQWKGGKPS